MEPTDRLITAAVYLTVGVVVGVAALVLFRYYGGIGGKDRPAEVVDGGPRPRRVESDGTGFSHGASVDQILAQRAQIKRLQSLLDQKTTLLEKKTALLDQKTREQAALQKELGEAIDMIEMFAAEVLAEAEEPTGRKQDTKPLQTEMERLRTDSEKNRTAAEQQQAELDLLMMELEATDEEIAQLEQETELALSALIAEKEAFEEAMTTMFVQMGEEAVPILVEYLANPQPGIRRWAASTLGEIGPLARDAVLPLSDLNHDLEPEVREAAKAALAKIDVAGGDMGTFGNGP